MRNPEMVRRAHVGKDGDPGWYRVHRRLSIGITLRLLPTPVRPVQVSLAMMAVWLAGAALVAAPGSAANLAGFGLLYLAFLLDKVDGELARLRGTASARGVLLDRFHHRLVEPTLFLAAAWHDYARRGDAAVLAWGFATALLANVIEEHQQLAPYIFLKRLREDGGVKVQRPATPRGWRRARVLLRPLKIFRTPITVLPLLLAGQLGERALGRPLVGATLAVSAVGLAIYLLFQCLDYYRFRLDEEFVEIALRHGWPSDPVGARRRPTGGAARRNPSAAAPRPVPRPQTPREEVAR